METKLVYAGKRVKVSVVLRPICGLVHSDLCIEPHQDCQPNIHKIEIVIERLAGVNALGEKQWVIVAYPSDELLELAEELIKVKDR